MTPAVADKLAKLLRMLTSSFDGERLAAVDRLNALVTAHDVDWDQALANGGSNEHALTQEDMQRIYAEGYERGLREAAASKPTTDDWAPAGRSRATEVGNRIEEVEQILEAAERAEADKCLSDFYSEFCASMRDRVLSYGARTYISEKQWGVLDKLRSLLQRTEYL